MITNVSAERWAARALYEGLHCARIRVTARKIWLSMTSSFPLQAVYREAWLQLRC